jgi:hypothetical protein
VKRPLAVGLAAAVSLALVVVYLAAGGGDFEPTPPGDPCDREVVVAEETDLITTAERVGLVALDGAACDLGISRERLLLAVAGEKRLDVDEDRRNDAFRNGLREAIDEEERAGRLGGTQAALLRAGVEILPVDALLDRVFTR